MYCKVLLEEHADLNQKGSILKNVLLRGGVNFLGDLFSMQLLKEDVNKRSMAQKDYFKWELGDNSNYHFQSGVSDQKWILSFEHLNRLQDQVPILFKVCSPEAQV